MCGRFALGLNVSPSISYPSNSPVNCLMMSFQAEEVRTGVAANFPQYLGEQRRERARIQRDRRQVRDRASPPAQPEQQERATAADDQDEDEDGLSDNERQQRRHTRAASVPWDEEEIAHWRPGNFNIAPRSNVAVVRLRTRAEEREVSRLRGGGDGGEKVESESRLSEGMKHKGEGAVDLGKQEICIESMYVNPCSSALLLSHLDISNVTVHTLIFSFVEHRCLSRTRMAM